MKEISVTLYELTREEAKALPDGKEMLIFNPWSEIYKIDYAGKKSIANLKTAASELKYFIFDTKGCGIE